MPVTAACAMRIVDTLGLQPKPSPCIPGGMAAVDGNMEEVAVEHGTDTLMSDFKGQVALFHPLLAASDQNRRARAEAGL
jgi:hypothetical protein